MGRQVISAVEMVPTRRLQRVHFTGDHNDKPQALPCAYPSFHFRSEEEGYDMSTSDGSPTCRRYKGVTYSTCTTCTSDD
jgi:hypothetical protein